MPTREGPIVERCLTYLRKLSGSHWERRYGTPYTRRGQPDISGCYHGQRVEIEVKRPGERPTERQCYEMEAWRVAGARVFWVDTSAACREQLWEVLDEKDREVAP